MKKSIKISEDVKRLNDLEAKVEDHWLRITWLEDRLNTFAQAIGIACHDQVGNTRFDFIETD